LATTDRTTEIAWVLGQCDCLETLSLADCDLRDEAADELLEALPDAPKLRALDLRWNRFEKGHRDGKGVSADARVDASSQKAKSAAERQSEALDASFVAYQKGGKKAAYRPKWTRGQTSGDRAGASGSTARAVS
jgi:hypothetical protein